MRPLESIRVLDLSRVLAGPYCTMMLGDLGAEVLKVERPGTGDDTRQWGPPFAGTESAYFLCCNRNKQSLTVNLKTDEGRAIVSRLADQSDVLVENFLPGQLEGWGLGHAALSTRNPRLVYCSIAGFGQTGPRRDEPGYDILIQALSGVMSITGEADGSPMKLGVAISDLTTGMFACNAIVAALLAREKTGQGARLDLSLFDCTLAWLANVGSNFLISGAVPRRNGTAHPNIVPYQAFAAADGSLIVAVGNDAQFQRFCRAIDRDDLASDARFIKNADRVRHRADLIPDLAQGFLTRPAGEWLSRLREAEIPCGPVNTVAQALTDPQALARNVVVDAPHTALGTVPQIGSPMRFSDSPAAMSGPPLLGEHTRPVLKRVLGYSDAEIDALYSREIL